MSAHLSPAPRTIGLVGPNLVATLRLAWHRLRRAYALALRDEVSRRNLRRLDDRMLADIGISRAQAAHELGRRPWLNV